METKELIYVKAIVDKYTDKDIREKVNELFRIGKLIDSLNELINEEKQLIIDTKNKINRINKQLMQQQKILGVINKVKIKNNFTEKTTRSEYSNNCYNKSSDFKSFGYGNKNIVNSNSKFNLYEKVQHEIFGFGKIMKIEKDIYEVLFNNGTKKIREDFLKKLE